MIKLTSTRFHVTLVLLVLVFISSTASAAERIAVVFDSSKSFAQGYVSALKDSTQHQYEYVGVDLAQVSRHDFSSYYALIAVSSEVSNMLLQKATDIPMLHVMSPQVNVSRLVDAYPMKSQNWFLLTDQPGIRMYALLDQLGTDKKTIGVLYSKESEAYLQQLKRLINFTPYQLKAYTASSGEVREVIEKLVGEVDVLLAIPDELLFNRVNVRWLLYSAFQKNVPIVAFSKAFVDAGALAAVYSTEMDFAQQTQELLSAMRKSPHVVHRKIYPKYYQVSSNAHLQRNLSIQLQNESQLEELVRSAVKQYEKDIQQARN